MHVNVIPLVFYQVLLILTLNFQIFEPYQFNNEAQQQTTVYKIDRYL